MTRLDEELYKLRPRVPRPPHFRGSGKRRRNRHVYEEPEPEKPVKVGSLADDIREANRLKIDYGIYKALKMGRM
jgi:hypothetical protein